MATATPRSDQPEIPATSEPVAFIVLPMSVYVAMSNEAVKKNLTVAQVLSKAIENVLCETPKPRLLVENGERKGA